MLNPQIIESLNSDTSSILIILQPIMSLRFSIISVLLFLVLSCARQGSPSGGPKDEIPPKYLGSNPDTLSLNVPLDLKEIRINFDEYVVLKDQQNNVIVSPSLGGSATFQPVGSASKTVLISLNEPLQENTTYNINFGNAIQDNNEGNILKYYQFVFSTGNYIDSLMVTGQASVLAERNQPKNLVVGLYKIDSAYKDSLILKQKPFYVAKPDEKGVFKLNYLHPGKYQMIAFNDEVQNMHFDSSKEKIGFLAQPLDLNANQEINISMFKQKAPYKAIKAEQKGYGHLVFKFQGEVEEIEVQPLDFDFKTSETSYQKRSDSLNFWFNPAIDSIAEKAKRIKFLVKHKDQTDTVSAVYNTSQVHKMKIDSKAKLGLAPGRKLIFNSNYPIRSLDTAFVSVFKDSIRLHPTMVADSKNDSRFTLDFPVELNSKYNVVFYPHAVTDFFGQTNDTIKYSFGVKPKTDYGNLKLKVETELKHPFFLRFLNDKDELLDEIYTTANEFEYNYLTPGNYYFQILVDENENGFWDTGDFFSRKYPEHSFSFPGLINVRAMWDDEEVWVLPSKAKPDEETALPEEDSED